MSENEDKKALEAFKPFEHFCKAMLDAYVVMNRDGRVLKSNQLFSQVVGRKTKQILKAKSITELLRFEVDGHGLHVPELMQYDSPTRIDEVAAFSETQQGMNLILGIYPFFAGEEKVGMFMLLRDVTAETHLQDKYKVKATQSVTDKLTGLYNRSYFDSYLPEAIKALEDGGENSPGKLSLVMADVDHFKKVNDTYGHQAGDFVLEVVSHIFKSNFRKTDVVCRYGGEEFLIILPATGIQEAWTAADKMRGLVEDKVFTHNDVVIPITISMGVAQVNVGEETGEQLLARADAALYYAKEHGRNRVCKSLADGSMK